MKHRRLPRLIGGLGFAAAAALLAGFAQPAFAQGSLLGSPNGKILLQADNVVYDVNAKMVTAEGHVEIDYNGRILLADKVSYNQKTDTVTASGNVSVMAPNGDVAFANSVKLTDRMRDGALEGFAALIGKNGRVVAASGARSGGGAITEATRAAYTPCKICKKENRTPEWDVKAYRVIYNQPKHKIEFRDAVLDVLGVPVFYSPYFVQPDPTVKHATGLLPPEFGSASTLGQFVRLPVYIALSDSQDITLAPWLTTLSGEVLQGEYRQRFSDGGGMWLQGGVAYNPEGGLSGHQDQVYGYAFGAGRFPLGMDWSTGYDLALTTNDTWLQRYDISYDDQLVNDIFVVGERGRSRFSVSGYYFQDLRAGADAKTIPFVLPIVDYSYIPEHHVLGGQFQFHFNTAVVNRDLGEDDQRITGEMTYRLPFVTPDGQEISLLADLRGDVYHIDNANPMGMPSIPADSYFVFRGLPTAEIDWRWPFIKTNANGVSYVLQPIVQGIVAPYGGNPAKIPDEDSSGFEFSDENLLSFDPFPGYDLVDSGPRANVAVQGEMIFPTGKLDALLGQSFRRKANPVFSANSGLSGTVSDLVERIDAQFDPYFDLTQRLDFDEASGTLFRNEIYLTGSIGRSSIRVSYVKLPDQTELNGLGPSQEVNAQTIIGLFDHWSALAAADRDLNSGKLLDTEFGVGYEDDCLAISLAYRRRYTTDRDVPPSTSVLLRINLKTGDEAETPYDLFPQDVFAFPESLVH